MADFQVYSFPYLQHSAAQCEGETGFKITLQAAMADVTGGLSNSSCKVYEISEKEVKHL